MKRLVATMLLLLLLGPGASGDIIYLASGTRLRGTIIEETEEAVKLRTPTGTITTIARSNIDRIDRGASAEAIFERKLAELQGQDAQRHYLLAMWCLEENLRPQYVRCLEQAIALDAGHVAAREELGYHFHKGRWLAEAAYHQALGHVFRDGVWWTAEEISRLDQGLVKYGDEWMSRERAEALERGDLPEAPPEGEAGPPAELPEDLKALLELARGADRARAREAWKSLLSKGAEARAELKKLLLARYHKRLEGFRGLLQSERSLYLKRLVPLVVQRRKEAFDFIMDPAKYPEENHGEVAQPKVDELVKALREVYENPHAYLYAKVKPYREAFDAFVADVDELGPSLKELRAELPGRGKELALKVVRQLIRMDRVSVNDKEQQGLAAWFAILEANAKAKTSEELEEKACVLATNRYRMMFGLRPVEVEEALIQAARKHSDDMRVQRYFDHTSRDGRTPDQRCAAEGARYSGENIAMGYKTGAEAFDGWYHSSGHHRNILTAGHRKIGVGRSGLYWTQDFGP